MSSIEEIVKDILKQKYSVIEQYLLLSRFRVNF